MKCKQCAEELINMREDAIYCNPNCKQKQFKRKKRIRERIKKIGRLIEFEIGVFDHYSKLIEEHREKLLQHMANLKRIKGSELYPHLVELIRVKKLSDRDFWLERVDAFQKQPDQYWILFIQVDTNLCLISFQVHRFMS